MAGKPAEARQNGQGIWLYNAERLLRFLLLQLWLQDICSTRLEAFAIERAIAADPDLTLLGRLVASQQPTNLFPGNSYRLVVMPERALVIQQLAASFKLGVPSMSPQTSGRSTHKRFSKYMGYLRQARGRPLRLRIQDSLPNVLFEGQEHVGPWLAQPPPLCFPSNRPDPAGNQANPGTEAKSSVSGPALEEPALACGAVLAARYSPMAYSSETRPPLSGEWNVSAWVLSA